MPSKFIISDNLDYEPRLYSDDGHETDRKEINLYEVALWNPFLGKHESPILVLAESEEDALGQAACKSNLSSYQISGEYSYETIRRASRAWKRSMLIQGWGKNEF